jgi:SAM-dependent methyltransferase
MSLKFARRSDGSVAGLTGDPPYEACSLVPLVGDAFTLPPGDPFVLASGDSAHAYLDGAKRAWEDHPDWMDFLDEDSPGRWLKELERGLYLHHWRRWLAARRVMDVGCGIGRFVHPLLDRGADVWGVDADLASLRACLNHAAGRRGRLDLAWTSAHALPEVTVDAVIACEVLCYVPDVVGALAAIRDRLTPGGALLISVEARWGWAASADAPADAVTAALSGEVVDVPGDRWVKTYERDELCELLDRAGFEVAMAQGTHWFTDGPLERVLPPEVSVDQLLGWEDRARQHPTWGALNRAWTAAATRR